MKSSKWLVLLLGVLVAAVVFSLPAQARSYKYLDLTIDAWIQPDGAVRIIENRTVKFDGTFRGMFQWIDTSQGIGVEDVVVEENGEPYRLSPSTVPGPAGTYFVREDPDAVYVDWSFLAVDETRTFTLKYTLTNAVVVHSDVAELYIQFVGKEWEQPVEQVKVTLYLPGEGSEAVRAWGHGPLHGEVTIAGPDTVIWQVSPLPARTFLEGRVTFPPELVPEAKRRTGQPALESILQEEAQWAKAANRQRILTRLDMLVAGLAVATAIGVAIWSWYRWGREYPPEFDGDYYRELPQDYSPAVMSVLYNFGSIHARDLTATVLDLARRGFFVIEAVETGTRRKSTDYRFVRKEQAAEKFTTLRLHEQELMRFLFEMVDHDKDGAVTLKEVKRYAKQRSQSFVEFWKAWQELVQEEAAKFDFFDADTATRRTIQLAAGVVTAAVSAVTFVIGWTFAGIGLIAAGFILIFGALLLRRRSANGSTQFAQWRAFRRFLLHFSELERYDVGSLQIWEHYLVYAVSLGVAKEVIRQLRVVFPNLEQDGYRFGYGWYYYGAVGAWSSFEDGFADLTRSVESSLQQAISAATSKMSSGAGYGGGFSGGGGGGVGGGGGGVR